MSLHYACCVANYVLQAGNIVAGEKSISIFYPLYILVTSYDCCICLYGIFPLVSWFFLIQREQMLRACNDLWCWYWCISVGQGIYSVFTCPVDLI